MNRRYSTWPYVNQAGRPNVAQFAPWGYPTLDQTDAYRVYGMPPRPKNVNHLLHLVLSIMTVGFWVPIWFVAMIVVHNANTQAEAVYWSRIQQYYQWEISQRALVQGG